MGNRARLDFHKNYAENGDPPPPIYAKSGETITIPEKPRDMNRNGFVFLCWNSNPAPNKESTDGDVAPLSKIEMPDQGGILYARWGDQATAKFDTKGGSPVPDQVKTPGQKWEKPAPDPTREGYIFDGWTEGVNHQKIFEVVTANTTFTAKWKDKYKRITIEGTGDQAKLVLTDDPHDAGLYFKWGSVVGLYNAGGANSRLPGAVADNFSLDDIAFNPMKTNTVTDWKSVPYTTASTLAHDLYKVRDGLGDPCKLVGYTVAQVKSNNFDNKTWRMPTQQENFDFLSTQSKWGTKDGVNGIYGSWSNTFGYTSGSFMPSSGWRASENGSRYYAAEKPVYWSSTAGTNPNTGSAWEYTTTGPSFNLKANYDRGYAFPIRCVRQ